MSMDIFYDSVFKLHDRMPFSKTYPLTYFSVTLMSRVILKVLAILSLSKWYRLSVSSETFYMGYVL